MVQEGCNLKDDPGNDVEVHFRKTKAGEKDFRSTLRKDKKVKVQKGHYDKERDVSFCEVHLSSTQVC